MEYLKIKLGNIEAPYPPEAPTMANLVAWKREFIETVDISGYELYLVGNFAEKTYGISDLPTMDVDISIIGDLGDLGELKIILDQAHIIGFKHKLIIDIFYNNKLLDFTTFDGTYYIKNYVKSYRLFTDDSGELRKMTQNNQFMATDIGNGLYKYILTPNSAICNKVKSRVASGKYVGMQRKF